MRSGIGVLTVAVTLGLSLPATSFAQAPGGALSEALGAARSTIAIFTDTSARTALAEHQNLQLDVARDHLLHFEPQQAQNLLDALIEGGLDEGPARRAKILQGRAALSQGLGVQARTHLDGVDPQKTGAPFTVVYLQAQAAEMSGDPARAAELYGHIVAAEPDTEILHKARAAHPVALYKAGQLSEAEKSFADLIKRYPEYPQSHVAMYQRGQILLKLDPSRHKEGVALMHKVWWNYPWKEEGAKARLVLDDGLPQGVEAPRDSVSSLLERATYLRKRKHWSEAEQSLTKLLARVESGEGSLATANEIRLQIALVAYDMQDWEVAHERLLAMETRAKAREAGVSLGFVQDMLQRAYHRSGDPIKAAQMLTTRTGKGNNKAWARFYWLDGQYKMAKKHTDRFIKARDRKGWDYAFLTYKTGEYKSADRLFSAMLGSRELRGKIAYEQVLYWVARTRQNRGMEKSARDLFGKLVADYPWSYYGHQARSRLIDMDRAAPETSDNHEMSHATQARVYWDGSPESAPAPNLEALFDRERLNPYITERPTQGAARRAAAAHGDIWPELVRAAYLYDIGLDLEAQVEMRRATQEHKGLSVAFAKGAKPTVTRPISLGRYKKWGHYVDNRRTERRGYWGLALKPLYPVPRDAAGKAALYRHQMKVKNRRSVLRDDLQNAMMEVGDHFFVRRMRFGRGPWYRTDPAGEYRELWTEAFPRAFSRLVTHYAEKEGLSPYLLWAIMTVESAYNPDTISYADARGLLQVIPKTGNKVAAALGESAFGHYDLMHPHTSVRHGAWYFKQLVDKFRGQEPLAIASYNGGPHNIMRWLIHKHDQPLDEFVEEIEFDQARRYTKRVLRYLGLFLRIYEGSSGLYIGQQINSDILVEPRY